MAGITFPRHSYNLIKLFYLDNQVSGYVPEIFRIRNLQNELIFTAQRVPPHFFVSRARSQTRSPLGTRQSSLLGCPTLPSPAPGGRRKLSPAGRCPPTDPHHCVPLPRLWRKSRTASPFLPHWRGRSGKAHSEVRAQYRFYSRKHTS